MYQCIQFLQLIGGHNEKRLKLLTNKKLKNVYTIKMCSMYKLFVQ